MPRLAALLLITTAALAQSDGLKPPPGPKPPGDNGPMRREGERRGPPGMPPGKGRPSHFEGFEKLSEEERAKVRAAFEKAWQRPEVITARDLAMKANEDLREKLRIAVEEIDPAVAKVLEKVKPPFPVDPRGLPELPRPESPDFARMAAIRLGAEMLSMARPERREETRRFHERIMQFPRLKEALARLEQAPPAERMEGFMRLRDLYREITGEEFRRLRDKPEGKDAEGFRRPPGATETREPEPPPR